MAFLRVLVACLLVSLLAPPVGAQVLEPPPRLYRGLFGGGPPPDPNRSRQELALTGSALGGYDDNLTAPTLGYEFVPHPSGYTGFADAGMRYSVGRQASRFLEVRGRGFMNTYRNIGLGPSYGGEESVRGRITFGRRTDLEVTQGLRYDPYFSLGLFGVIQAPDLPSTPDSQPSSALAETRSWTTSASSTLTHRWTRRTVMDLGVSFSNQTYVQKTAFDTRSVFGSFGLERAVSPTTSLRGAYRPSDSEYAQADGRQIPLGVHTFEGGVTYRHRVSRTRQVTFNAGGGPMYVSTIAVLSRAPREFWKPAGYGTIRVDLWRSWSVAGDYRRSVTTLQGDTPEPFVTDAALVSAGGLVRRWLETVLSAGYSNGQAGQGSSIATELAVGRYDGYTVAAQARLRLSRLWSAVVSFNHYQYHLNSVASQVLNAPPELHRNAVRAGVAWALPLLGSYLGPPPDVPAAGRD